MLGTRLALLDPSRGHVDHEISLFYSGSIGMMPAFKFGSTSMKRHSRSRTAAVVIGALTLGLVLPPVVLPQEDSYLAEIEGWRSEREQKLTADDGWLTVTGLFFLREGENTFGTDPLNDIVLPSGPPQAGTFVLRNRVVTVQAASDHTLSVDGEDITTSQLYPREERANIQVGELTLFVHYSGDRLAIRMRDPNSVIRQGFTRLQWYPVDEGFRVPAQFVPHDEPITVTLQNILGDVETFTSYGSVRLSLRGESLELLPVDSDGRLWFIFRDLTSGTDTYPAARFLYADPPENGWTVVDFNMAYNPPCAFNPHTTCPLPPTQNRLPVRVEAGERNYQP